MNSSTTPSVSPLFERITELARLEEGWERVRRNGGAAGGDGVTLRDYGEGLALRLIRLHRDLRQGTYVPGPLRRVDIPKKDGGLRTLAIPCVNDRVAQTAATLVLGPRLDAEMEDASFAYRPGRSVRRAVARVATLRRAGYGWVVDGDIERYFDNVPHDRLLRRLERSVAEPALIDLIAVWLDAFSPEGCGLPQGGPISPLLANLYLDDIDESIETSGVRLVRFADDFLLMCRSESAATQARDRMAALLASHGLRLHPDKTRVVPFEQGFRFLGHLFVRSIVVQEIADDDSDPDTPVQEVAAALNTVKGGLADDPELAEGSDGASPGLRVLYLMEPGRRLQLRNEAFVVVEDGAEIAAFPPHRVDRIEIGPGADASTEALRHAADSDTMVAFVNGWGETVGTVIGRPSDRAARQLDQARHVIEPDLRLDLARRFVDGRIRNQRALLNRLNRRRDDEAVRAVIVGLGRVLRKLPLVPDVPTLMGHEGEAAALYWPAYGSLLDHGWSLERRRRRPPPDGVNLMLSYLASMLHRDLSVLVVRRGLNPGFGLLHETQDYHPGCVSDLIEELRAPLVEAPVAFLLNTGAVRLDMVETSGPDTVRFTAEGRRRVIRGYESWMDRPIRSPRTGRTIKWRRLMDEQVQALAEHIGGGDSYRPYRMDY